MDMVERVWRWGVIASRDARLGFCSSVHLCALLVSALLCMCVHMNVKTRADTRLFFSHSLSYGLGQGLSLFNSTNLDSKPSKGGSSSAPHMLGL